MADTLSENAVYVPDGRLVGTGLIASTDDTYHGMSITATITGVPYTYSVFAAPEDKNWIVMGIPGVVGPCFFDVEAGVVGVTGSLVDVAEIQGPYKGGYTGGTDLDFYRCWISFTAGAGEQTFVLLLANSNDPDDIEFAGDGVTVSSYFWGAQVELGSRPSSPIITAGAAATRLGDELEYDTLSDYDKGTIVCNVISDAAAVEEGTIISVMGDVDQLRFHTDASEHISMKEEANPS